MNSIRQHIRCGRRAAAVLLLLLLPGVPAAAQIDEYQAKAIFLYKVTSFVEWPARALNGPGEPLTICVLGQTPFEEVLRSTVKNKQIEGRGFTVRQAADARQIAGCHLLFVSAGGMKRFRAMREEFNAITGVLVMGESEGFATEGGVINFKLVDGRFRVEINLAEAKREKLVINSRLLGLAEVVGK